VHWLSGKVLDLQFEVHMVNILPMTTVCKCHHSRVS